MASAAAIVAAMALGVTWLYGQHVAVGVGDEGVYLADALLWAREGKRPYVDVFLAHPPLRVALSALAIVLGMPVVAGKWLAIAATLGSGLLAAACGARLGGPVAAVIAAACWYGSPLVLETGGVLIGPDLTTLLMLAALLAALRDAFRGAGLLATAAALAAYYGLLVVPPLAVLAWQGRRRGAVTSLALGLLALPLALLALQLATDGAFFEQTVLFQLDKLQSPPEAAAAAAAAPAAGAAAPAWPWPRILGAMQGEATLLALALTALPALRRPSDASAAVAAGAWFSLVPVLAFRSFAPYYLVGPLGLLAVAAGAGVATIAAGASNPGPGVQRRRVAVLAAAALLWALGAVPASGEALARRAMQPVVDAELELVAAKIRARPAASKRLWGDTAVTPVLSLRSGLAIAADMVDTNDKRFAAGSLASDDVLAMLQRERPGILLIPQHGPFRVNAIRAWVERHYEAVFWHRGLSIGYDVVYLLPSTAPAGPQPFDRSGSNAPP